nr:retrovirus-related Pol polyprotein from transposon TNT 1-94 [Tanacetum cinerariifolium]
YRDLNAEFEDCSDNSSNEVNAVDASQLPDDPDMPELENITYSDDEDVVGAEVDFNNLESSIPFSPIPTTRIHKGKPASTPIDTEKPLLKDPEGEDVDIHTYSTNTFSAAGPSNTIVSPTYRKSSFIDASQLPDDLDMPELEDISYSDDEDVVGAEADFNNLESSIPNRVLVTKPHNKTPYELLHGRTPSIGFMRPFGCPVTILNTLDPLGKFQRNVDEGFLVGYFVCSKAFRVFNSRTRIIQETLHVNFLENKPNVPGNGPIWLFDIDSLTRTMNYQPVTIGNQTNSSVGFQDKFNAGKAGEEVNQQYVLFLVNVQSRKQDDKTKKEAKRNSPVESFTGYRDLNAEFKDCTDNSSNEVNAAGSIVPTVKQNSLNSTNTFSAAGPSNTIVSPT